jgi:hypothetical protein
MPYNINIQAVNAGKQNVQYTVIPSPKRIPLTDDQLAAIKAAPTIQELQAKIREAEDPNKGKVQTTEPDLDESINVEDVPF